jgi:arginase family enzyme
MALHNDPNWPRAGEWIASGIDSCELAIIGVGASKSAITPNRADTTPAAVRDALLRYSSFDAASGHELTKLSARDFGDLDTPDNQDVSIGELQDLYKLAKVRVLIGGDNSITYSGVGALAGADYSNIGLITLDAHHDVRDGISNGSPIRQLVAAGLPGANIVQIGINNFANSKFYADRCADWGISIIHRDEFEISDPRAIAKRALEKLKNCTEIYLDIDIDVCDRSVVPAAPAAMPGGISAYQLRAIVRAIAADSRVNTFDITEIDASIDSADQRTTRLAALCILEIAAAKVGK